MLSKTWQVMSVCNGILAGLVSITAGCSVILPPHALLVGSVGGLVYLGVSHLTLLVLKVDDPLDAFAVHGGCGLWGLLAASLFAHPLYVGSIGLPTPGAFYGDATLLTAAAVGSLAIVAWVGISSSLLFLLLQRLGLLRVDVQSELVGLDCIEHDGPPPSPARTPGCLGLTPPAFPEERVHAGGHAGGWWAAGQLPALEEPAPTAGAARPNGRHRAAVGVVSSHRVVGKAASVHGGESWRPSPPASWGGKQPPPASWGGKQPSSSGGGLRRVSSTGAVHMPMSSGAAAARAAAAVSLP